MNKRIKKKVEKSSNLTIQNKQLGNGYFIFTEETFNDFYDELKDTIRENNYKNRKTYEHQFTLEDCFNDLDDIKDCDYKYYKEGE